jgi:hypothetical protein
VRSPTNKERLRHFFITGRHDYPQGNDVVKSGRWIQDAIVPALVKLEKNNAVFANIGG